MRRLTSNATLGSPVIVALQRHFVCKIWRAGFKFVNREWPSTKHFFFTSDGICTFLPWQFILGKVVYPNVVESDVTDDSITAYSIKLSYEFNDYVTV